MRSVPVLLSHPAAIVYCTAAITLHEIHGEPGGAPAITALLASYLLGSTIALWIVRDAHRTGRSPAYDFDSLVFIEPFVVAPIYLFYTRGARAFIPIGFFLLLTLAAILAVAMPTIIASNGNYWFVE